MEFPRVTITFGIVCICLYLGQVTVAKESTSYSRRVASLTPPRRKSPPRNLTFLEVYEHLEDCSLLLVDVRNRSEFYRDPGHIPGSFNVPLPELQAAFDKTSTSDKAFYLDYGFTRPEKPGTGMAVMCLAGVRAGRAIGILEKLGYTDVDIYAEGLRGWSVNGGRYCKYGPVPLPSTNTTTTPIATRPSSPGTTYRKQKSHQQYFD